MLKFTAARFISGSIGHLLLVGGHRVASVDGRLCEDELVVVREPRHRCCIWPPIRARSAERREVDEKLFEPRRTEGFVGSC